MSFRDDLLGQNVTPVPVSEFGIKGRKEVYLDGQNCGVLIDRKSRYLRKDAHGFLALKEALEKHQGGSLKGWVLLRTAPLCSKAKTLLEEAGVHIEQVD